MISEELFAALTNRSILDQRFATSLSEQTIPMLNEMARYIRERLSREGESISSITRLNKLLADIEAKTSEIYTDIQDLYIEQFRPFSVDEAAFTAQALQSVIVSDIIVESPTNQRLWNAVTKNPINLGGNNGFVDFDAFIEDLGENSKKIASVISGGYSQGMSLQEITRQIIGTRSQNYSDGIIDKSRREANTIVRTAVNHIATQARDEVYKQNRRVVWGYTLLATLDISTSAICRFYDGKSYSYKDEFQPKPPFHPNCRTTMYPEVYGTLLRETDATRAANFKANKKLELEKGTVGQVSASQAYYDVLKQQPISQQDEVLGKARGLIFRNSGLSADEFRKAMTDTMGNPLTLAEMAQKNKQILDYMQKNEFLTRYLGD